MNTYRSLVHIREKLADGSLTCSNLVDHYLYNINKNRHLNALVEIYESEARKQATRIDQKLTDGTAGPLAGLVVTIKDVLSYKDHPLQAGSHILDGFTAQYTATAVQRLIDADAIIIGRANCDEFGMGSSNENSHYGPTLNPHDNERVPGGSSGGSAVAVQADMCLIALGSDTGGSVRQPAAFCGVVGLKPTYSRISRHGLIAYASSFDCIGILGRTVEDVAIVLEHIAGPDDHDSTVSRTDVHAYSQSLQPAPPYNIAYIRQTVDVPSFNHELKANFHNQINQLQKAGNQVHEVDFDLLDYILPAYYVLTTAEASSNLSRYDGVRYGYRSADDSSLESMYKTTRTEGFGKEVQRRIMLGTFALSASYYEAFYHQAQKVRRLIRERTKKLLSEFDFIVMPTTPTTAFKLGTHSKDPVTKYLADLYTVQASLCGLPAISIPAGHDNNGLPIGLQIITDDFKEQKLLAFSIYCMQLN